MSSYTLYDCNYLKKLGINLFLFHCLIMYLIRNHFVKYFTMSFFHTVSDFTEPYTSLFNYENQTISTLSLPSVHLIDSGNYNCQPASLQRVVITLYVLQEQREQELVVKEPFSAASHSYAGLICPTVVFIRMMFRIFFQEECRGKLLDMFVHIKSHCMSCILNLQGNCE